ncbi:MAG: FtsX-like permease family protein [Candidatus Latescibacteria bacterium]|nr:FtsX-like permease family protein [Candidatus Latescibacterota bacterium]
MLQNYLSVAFRTLIQQKLYVFINIVGLAVGLACFVLISCYVQYEWNFDTFNQHADNIYRMAHRSPDVYMEKNEYASSPAPLAPALLRDFPEITRATALTKDENARLRAGDVYSTESGLLADEHLFSIFSFPMYAGNPETALIEPNTIVLTTSLSRKLFGDDDPMGQIIEVQGWTSGSYAVTGVIEDVPDNAHFTFDFVTSLVSEPEYRRNLENNEWRDSNWFTYFVLQDGVNITQLERRMAAFDTKYMGHLEPEDRMQFFAQSLTSIHLRSHLNFELSANGDIRIVLFLSSIALAILLLACINYMNLAVVRSMKRAREVGIRKVVGAYRGQLILQFIGESMLLSFLSMLLAIGLVSMALPGFSALLERDLSIDYSSHFWMPMGLLGLTLLVGFVSGCYPAFYVASMQPSKVLKGMPLASSGRSRLQSLLVVGQFAVSIALVLGGVIIYQQLDYIQNKEMGYNRERVLAIKADSGVSENYLAIKNELERQSTILGVTSSSMLITRISSGRMLQDWEGRSNEAPIRLHHNAVGYDFLDVFEIDLAEGRTFSPEFPSDRMGSYLINEAAVRSLGWKSGLGKKLQLGSREGTVIGVMKDFHLHSLHQPIRPLMFELRPDRMNHVFVKVRQADIGETVETIKRAMEAFTPYPLEYAFLDEVFDRQYKAETKLGQAMGGFSIIALLIASLGLFGLAAFTAEQKTREVGVRKVLGASVLSVVMLLTREFTMLVVAASAVAVPLAYLAMSRWLEGFVYRIEVGPEGFVVAVAFVLVIAWLSVSYQAFIAARANPVQSLQHK